MKWMTPTRKISFGIALLTVSLILMADLIGFVPNEDKGVLEGRKQFCESLAIQFSIAAGKGEFGLIKGTLDALVSREDEVVSAAIRNSSSRVIAQSGPHSSNWVDIPVDQSTSTHIQVPILRNDRRWGTVEIVFTSIGGATSSLGISAALLPLLLYVAVPGFFAYLFFIKRTLRELDPRAVIPDRVKSAFNGLAEGLVIVDEKGQIILANEAFSEKVEISTDSLIGQDLSGLNWNHSEEKGEVLCLPWQDALTQSERQSGIPMKFDSKNNGLRTFMVNSSPILDGKGEVRGILSTFDDMTDLETKHVELKHTISKLWKSRKDLQDKTVELEYLATRDPLTDCLNRRALFEKADVLFSDARENGTDVACIMADIDHFKLINDNFGHATGDKVIQLVSGELQSNARPDDLVGRYGGEEFCVIMPGTDRAAAVALAERFRVHIKQCCNGQFNPPLKITASFGVSMLSSEVVNPGELINQADLGLYQAKENGRNRVVAWDASLDTVEGEVVGDSTDEMVASPDDINTEHSDSTDLVPAELVSRITELEQELEYSQEAITQRDGRDAVTGLPNRLLFHDRIGQALASGERLNQISAVLVFDIDMFQRINDALGFKVGDKLLKKVSDRLEQTLRGSDTVAAMDEDATAPSVSRTGADEFGVLIAGLTDIDVVTSIAQRILDKLSEPLEIDGNELFITCSAGISLAPHDGDNADTLLQNANAARLSAKHDTGQNKYVFYSADLNKESYKQLWFENQLRHALDKGELYLRYQPKVDLKTGKITSMEALVRWSNEKLGIVSPVDFIHVAERTGLINAIGAWVMRAACIDAKGWADAGFEGISVAVNMSPLQFRQDDLIGQVTTMLSETELAPELLDLEITETAVMENFDEVVTILNGLTSTGIQVSVDDFGTGYSSLAYLKHLPINILKIDRSFLGETILDYQDKLIITAIIAMAHSMDLRVVAEGVESTAQKALLAGLGCDEIQGYLVSKPVPNVEVLELLEHYNGDGSQRYKSDRKRA